MVRSSFSQRIVATVAYCDQFDYPLTEAEIAQRLIQYSGDKATANLATTLTHLVKAGTLGAQDDFYFLPGSRSAIKIRQERAVYSALKETQAKEVVETLSRIPWIRGVAITGSLAMHNATEDDDLDFMIITQANRLWVTRPLVILYAWLKGKRRSWHKEEKNSWCFNLWLDEDELHAPGLNKSLYIAYEVCQAKFVLNRERVEERFIWANHWVAQYLPHYFVARCEEAQGAQKIGTTFMALLLLDTYFSWVFSLANELAFMLQWLYMTPHRTREKVTRSLAFFHPRDTQKVIHEKWRAAITGRGVAEKSL